MLKNQSIFQNVELHALSESDDLQSVVAVANEHQFRGIVTTHGQLPNLVRCKNKYSDSNIIPIAAIDYPYGCSTLDLRRFAVVTAAEKGAEEIEVAAPYYIIQKCKTGQLSQDIETITNQCDKLGIKFKYVFDRNYLSLNHRQLARILRVFAANRIDTISNGFHMIPEMSIPDSIIDIREFKKKTSCDIKAVISTDDQNELAQFPKAGVDLIGINWQEAASVTYKYQYMMEEQNE